MTQSIIVYRNPAEAAFWESGLAGPLFCGLAVFLIVMLAGMKLVDFARFNIFSKKYKYICYGVIACAITAGVFTAYKVYAQ